MSIKLLVYHVHPFSSICIFHLPSSLLPAPSGREHRSHRDKRKGTCGKEKWRQRRAVVAADFSVAACTTGNSLFSAVFSALCHGCHRAGRSQGGPRTRPGSSQDGARIKPGSSQDQLDRRHKARGLPIFHRLSPVSRHCSLPAPFSVLLAFPTAIIADCKRLSTSGKKSCASLPQVLAPQRFALSRFCLVFGPRRGAGRRECRRKPLAAKEFGNSPRKPASGPVAAKNFKIYRSVAQSVPGAVHREKGERAKSRKARVAGTYRIHSPFTRSFFRASAILLVVPSSHPQNGLPERLLARRAAEQR